MRSDHWGLMSSLAEYKGRFHVSTAGCRTLVRLIGRPDNNVHSYPGTLNGFSVVVKLFPDAFGIVALIPWPLQLSASYRVCP